MIAPMSQTIPMPPDEFQSLVCGPSSKHLFAEIGVGIRNEIERLGMLPPGVDFLDIGCGCGRLPRNLMELSIGSYTGFDRHKGMIEWCQKEISARDPRFHFDYFDLKSVYTVWDGQDGGIDTGSFRFPYADGAFNSVLLASVFTHMSPDETKQYLQEMARVMRPGGKAWLSIFFSPTGQVESRDEGINVFHSLPRFTSDLESVPFDVKFHGAEPPRLSFNYEQNWYVLTRRHH